jgi:hypothetical protein
VRIVIHKIKLLAPKATLNGAFAVVTVITTPIMLAGVAHLYPSLLFHVIVLPPVFALSGYLLFTSIPLLQNQK